MRWYVCDMDAGVLRIEARRRDTLTWAMNHHCAIHVLKRYKYGPGYYSYVVGHRGTDDGADIAIVREDKLSVYGITTAAHDIKPLYPYEEDPHRVREPDFTPHAAECDERIQAHS